MKKEFNSLHELYLNSANNINKPEDDFLLKKIDGTFQPISYKETNDNIDAIASWLVENGIKKGDKAAMVIENCPEYIYFDQALQKLGCVNTAIYPTLSAEEMQYIIIDSESNVILLGTPYLLKNFNKIESKCPNVKKAITLFDKETEGDKFITYQQMLKEGKKLGSKHSETIQASFESIKSDDLAALIYTSGTTGVPKGVMLSHNNLISNALDAIQLVPILDKDDMFLSFLPLSHVFERLATYIISTLVGCKIAFSEGLEKIATNMGEVKPSLLASVPRLLERIEDKVRKNATASGGIKEKIFNWAIRTGEKARINKENDRSNGLFLNIQHKLAHKLVYSKIQEKFGGNLKVIISGGGALPIHVGKFFANIGILVCEGYGLTETSPLISVNEGKRQVYGTVGRVAPSQQVALEDVETGEIITVQTHGTFDPNFECKEGEILNKGPNVMKGYYNKPAETAAVFDKDGWFHTGDIGKFEKGNLKITDRKKNMLVSSFGKNIYPTPVESTYLKSSAIDQIFLIGDNQEYVSAIIVPDNELIKSKFEYSDDFFEDNNPFIEDDIIKDWIRKELKALEQPLAKFERVKDFIIKRKPFSVEDNEMTITLKAKRKVITSKYKEYIEKIYSKK